MLRLDAVAAGYGRRPVLHGVSFSLGAGERIALVGHNGAGKSTILKAITGQLRLSAGSIHFEGRRIDGTAPEALVRRGIVQIPAGRRVFAELSVRQNLESGAFTRSDRAGIKADVAAMLERFAPLGRKAHLKAGVLSGGEQQMLAIARGLMARPRLLLVDEPSLGLAPLMVDQVFGFLKSLAGLSLILAEQNVRKALATTDRAIVLAQGAVVTERPSAALLDDAGFREAYFGVPAGLS